MAEFDYDGQPEEIDEFAMFRARALGAESEYLLLKQASRRGNPRVSSDTQNDAADQTGPGCNGAVDGQAQPIVRTSSGRRRHASGQGGGSQSRSRRLAAGGSGASLEQQRRVDSVLTETVSAQHMLLSPGSFDEENDNDARHRPLQVLRCVLSTCSQLRHFVRKVLREIGLPSALCLAIRIPTEPFRSTECLEDVLFQSFYDFQSHISLYSNS